MEKEQPETAIGGTTWVSDYVPEYALLMEAEGGRVRQSSPDRGSDWREGQVPGLSHSGRQGDGRLQGHGQAGHGLP